MPKLPRQWTSSPVDMATNKKRVAYFYDGERPSRGTLHAHGRCRVPVGAPCACSARDSRPGVGQRFGAPFFSRREGGLGQGSAERGLGIAGDGEGNLCAVHALSFRAKSLLPMLARLHWARVVISAQMVALPKTL
jgi:hypothetical protein